MENYHPNHDQNVPNGNSIINRQQSQEIHLSQSCSSTSSLSSSTSSSTSSSLISNRFGSLNDNNDKQNNVYVTKMLIMLNKI